MSTAGVSTSAGVLASLCAEAGEGLVRQVAFTSPSEFLPSVYPVTAAAMASVGAATQAAARLWATRLGRPGTPEVAVDGRHAAAAFRSERYLEIDGQPAPDVWEPLSGNYRTAEGRWLLLHANMPGHRAAALRVLGAAPDKQAVADAIAGWAGEELEDALAAGGGCCAMARSHDEWSRHPQSGAIAGLPLVEIERIGDAPAPSHDRPDRAGAGLRVLDMTRVIAGPVATRTLAAHGADVLRVGAPQLWDVPTLVMDTGFAKRSAFLDAAATADADALHRLAATADVFVQGYRPGSLAARGFSPETLVEARPGLVCVEISAYGRLGPWSGRRGFDSLVQMASGIALAGGERFGDGRVSPLPAQALDHATGYLAAAGAMVALQRQFEEGGSWLVRVSLARTGQWLTSAGRVAATEVPDPERAAITDLTAEMDSDFGRLRFVTPPGWIDGGLSPRWDTPPPRLGADAAGWLR